MTPFPRTMRSLNANRARPWLIALGSAMLVLLAWIGWFVFASITFNEVSENVQVVKSNIVMASFNSESIKRIKKGQAAYLDINDGLGQPSTVPATVTDVNPELGEVRLVAKIETLKQQDLAGQVTIEVENLSPAIFILRTAGILAES